MLMINDPKRASLFLMSILGNWLPLWMVECLALKGMVKYQVNSNTQLLPLPFVSSSSPYLYTYLLLLLLCDGIQL